MSLRLIRLMGLLALAAGSFACLHGFSLNGSAWPVGDIPLELQLGNPSAPLLDGATSWNDVAESALQEWNAAIGRVQFIARKASLAPQVQGYNKNNIFFSDTVYGDTWDNRVNSVTIILKDGEGTTTETDVLFNRNKVWDSYRGNLRTDRLDFRRVILHELGHVLGLDHPDEAQPVQTVSAIMNSIPSNTEHLTGDDIGGARSLYQSPSSPRSVLQFSSLAYTVGEKAGTAQVTLVREGSLSDSVTVQFSTQNKTAQSGVNYTSVSQQITFDPGVRSQTVNVPILDDGIYNENRVVSLTLTTPSSTATLGDRSFASLVINEQDLPAGTQKLSNISTRAYVGAGDQVAIGGFILRGSGTRKIAIRVVAPSLTNFNVPNVLADATLDLRDGSGNRIKLQDDWDEDQSTKGVLSATQQEIVDAGLPPTERQEAVFIRTLPEGNYTAIVDGLIRDPQTTEVQGQYTGIALVEIFDLQNGPGPVLVNISTRANVLTSDGVMIGGFIVGGNTPQKVVIRAIGPNLQNYGIATYLRDPQLRLVDSAGNTVASNNDWKSTQQQAIRDASLAPVYDKESAIVATLAPGAYTCIVSGADGGTGIALVEVFTLQN